MVQSTDNGFTEKTKLRLNQENIHLALKEKNIYWIKGRRDMTKTLVVLTMGGGGVHFHCLGLSFYLEIQVVAEDTSNSSGSHILKDLKHVSMYCKLLKSLPVWTCASSLSNAFFWSHSCSVERPSEKEPDSPTFEKFCKTELVRTAFQRWNWLGFWSLFLMSVLIFFKEATLDCKVLISLLCVAGGGDRRED